MLLDEVDREAVAAGRDRRAQRERLAQRAPGSTTCAERRAQPVPDDRVPALVEPVVGEEETVLDAARAPWRRAGVLDLDGHVLERARLDRRALERAPARDEGAGSVHGGASVGA